MVYVSTHAGRRHRNSEDAVLVGTKVLHETDATLPVPKRGFVCVADGVGGNDGGALASKAVLSSLAEWKYEIADLEIFLKETNDNMIAAALNGPAHQMATTLTGFLLGETNTVVHVGNTRAYVKQGRYLKQITSDHTTYNWLLSNGQFEAAERCNKSEITNCFGGGNPALLSKLSIVECQQFSLALLTTDGIHDYVSIDAIEDILDGDGSYSDKCEALIQKAIDEGSEDDMSVVIVCPFE